MEHKQTLVAKYEGFGFITLCTCGVYSVHVPGVSLKLSNSEFEALRQMIQEVQDKNTLDQQELEKEHEKAEHLNLIK